MRFSEQESKAFDLGTRMAEAGFSLQDNPFMSVHPRFSERWTCGFLAVGTLKNLASAMSLRVTRRPDSDSPAPLRMRLASRAR